MFQYPVFYYISCQEGQLQGTSFQKGDTVQCNGHQCTICARYMYADGVLQVQNISGVVALAEALEVNRALTSLNLEYNRIGAGGAKAIADSLPQS